jgi:glutathione S-transferase
MKLFLNAASPYARLIRMLLIETGLESETDLRFVDPWNADEELLGVNPAGKIPALCLDDGTHLIESTCIADYLVHRSGRQELFPLTSPDAPVRLEILGLGRAALDCSFGAVIQHRSARESPLAERWLGALPHIARRLDALYAQRTQPPAYDIGDFTVAAAFDYIDFRLPQVNWRSKAAHLNERISAFAERRSFATTRPE